MAHQVKLSHGLLKVYSLRYLRHEPYLPDSVFESLARDILCSPDMLRLALDDLVEDGLGPSSIEAGLRQRILEDIDARGAHSLPVSDLKLAFTDAGLLRALGEDLHPELRPTDDAKALSRYATDMVERVLGRMRAVPQLPQVLVDEDRPGERHPPNEATRHATRIQHLTQHPARELTLRVDGSDVARLAAGDRSVAVDVPNSATRLMLIDEMDAVRADAALVPETGPGAHDRGRIQCSVEDATPGRLRVTVSRNLNVPLQLAAAAEATAQTSAAGQLPIAFRLRPDTFPQVDDDGFFAIEGYCPLRHAGRTVRVVVHGVCDLQTALDDNAELRLLPDAAPGRRVGPIEPADIGVFLDE